MHCCADEGFLAHYLGRQLSWDETHVLLNYVHGKKSEIAQARTNEWMASRRRIALEEGRDPDGPAAKRSRGALTRGGKTKSLKIIAHHAKASGLRLAF